MQTVVVCSFAYQKLCFKENLTWDTNAVTNC